MQDRIRVLEGELELSSFLNKGVLQTNTEHKLRIAELEAENEILRSTESKLAAAEDELEDTRLSIQELRRDMVEGRKRKDDELVGLKRDKKRMEGEWRRVEGDLKALVERSWKLEEELRRAEEERAQDIHARRLAEADRDRWKEGHGRLTRAWAEAVKAMQAGMVEDAALPMAGPGPRTVRVASLHTRLY
jgi:chromosome segregation ATPase